MANAGNMRSGTVSRWRHILRGGGDGPATGTPETGKQQFRLACALVRAGIESGPRNHLGGHHGPRQRKLARHLRIWPSGIPIAVPCAGADMTVMGKPISTSPALLAALERARNHVITPQEKFEQRVSFVYGQCHKSGRSKDEIRQSLIDMIGHP